MNYDQYLVLIRILIKDMQSIIKVSECCCECAECCGECAEYYKGS